MAVKIDSIRKGVRIKPPKVVLYGVGGIGKTTWAAAAPKPIFLFTEEGQGMLDVPRFEPDGKPTIQSWEQAIECLSVLHSEEHDFNTVVIDSLDFCEPLLQSYAARSRGKDGIEDFGFGKGYTFAVDDAMVMLRWLDALRDNRNMAIILICHAESKRFESPDAESYDRYKLKLHDRLAARVYDWADCVLFSNYKAHVVRDKEAFGQERKRAVGIGERIIYTEERPAFWAKNRYSLPPELPMSWGAFQDAVSRAAAAARGAGQQPDSK